MGYLKKTQKTCGFMKEQVEKYRFFSGSFIIIIIIIIRELVTY